MLVMLIATALSAGAQNEKGQKTFGLQGGYVTRNTSGAAGLEFTYSFSNHFRLAPSIDYIFSHNSTDGLIFNIDYQGPYSLNASKTVNIFPIAGICYSSWHKKEKNVPGDTSDDVSTRRNRFGINLGAGIEYYATPSLKLSLKGKFNWVKSANTGLFYVGISYVF